MPESATAVESSGAGRASADGFEAIVRRHAPRLLGVAQRILRDDSEAQDAVQDALLSAHRSLHCFRGESAIGSWLFKITVNAALMRLRRQKRLAEEPLERLEPQRRPDAHRRDPEPPWCKDPEATVGVQQLLRLVFAEMARLPESQRHVLLLRDVQGMSTEEAAELLSIRPGALKVRLHRARCALRALMQPHLTERVALAPTATLEA